MSDIPAAGEVIGDGDSEVLFRMGDREDRVAKTLQAAHYPSTRAAIGRRARAWVEAHPLPFKEALPLRAFAGLIQESTDEECSEPLAKGGGFAPIENA